MPKIKFSALVSGMSGKANGSVFATNNGGAYFRTNASKIKPNTASNSKRKSLFAGISQAWRSLTSEQQTAWNDSVSGFVVQNAFGDNRTPTGYEVFTRLNNTRATYGLPQLILPPTPRDLPAVGSLELEFPDLFQFYPAQALANFNRSNPSQSIYYVNPDILNGTPVMVGNCVSMLCSVAGVNQSTYALQQERVLWDVECMIDELLECVLVPTIDGKANIRVAGSAGTFSWSKTTTTAPVDMSRPFSVSVYLSPDSANDIMIFIDGILADGAAVQPGAFNSPTGDGGLRIGKTNPAFNQRTVYSDVRFYDNLPSTLNMQYVGYGYFVGSETYVFPFDQVDPSGTTPNVTPTSVAPFASIPVSSGYTLLGSFSSERIPYMGLTVDSEGLEGVNLNIYATAPVSFGKTGKITNFRLIASVPWSEETTFLVSEFWRERFKAFSPNGYINFYVQVFDTTTGVIPATQIKPPKRKPFKAGAESSSAVS